MYALRYDGALHLNTDTPKPDPASGQALLKILQAGICNTDLEIARGYMGFRGTLGHEFVAEVVEGSSEWVGKRVVGEINVACGNCDYCDREIPSQCRNRTTVGIDRHDGAFAEYMALSAKNLYVVPTEVSNDEAVFVEPLAAALQMHEAIHISPRDRIVLIGAGKLGMLCAQVLKLTGANLSVVVRRRKQRELLSKWGINAVSIEEVDERSADIVVDCTGNEGGFSSAINIVKPRGTILLKSTYVGLPKADLTRVVVDEVRVIGSRCGPFDSALRLLSAGLIDVKSMIDARYPITSAEEAFQFAAQPGVLKVVLDF